ncbi:MAG: hypothetical protein M1378_02835 [Bacteroidetes bacterium]|nr:hypothetical protein [Bacteroidota bacterium]
MVVNQESGRTITAKIGIPNAGELMLAMPEHPDAMPTSGTLQFPAGSAAVVMEQ